MRADLAWPTAIFDGSIPRRAGEHVGTLQFIDGGVRGLIRNLDGFFLAADVHGQGPASIARDGEHARHFAEIGHVLSIVYLVENRLVLGIDVHAGDHQIFCFCHINLRTLSHVPRKLEISGAGDLISTTTDSSMPSTP